MTLCGAQKGEEPCTECGWGSGCALGRGSYVPKALTPQRGAMLKETMGVREGKASLERTVDEGPVGTKRYQISFWKQT